MSKARVLIEAIDPKRLLRDVPQPLYSYHFSLGNSSEGPIGYAGRVIATSRQEAIQILKDSLPESVTIPASHSPANGRYIEYLEVYLNPEAISEADIDEEERHNPRGS